MKLKYCFLDLDGTLIDVSEKYYRTYCDLMKQYHFKPLPKQLYWELKRNKVSERDILALSGAEIDNYPALRKLMIEQEYYQKFDELFSFTLDFLKSISLQCESLILVTLRHNRESLLKQLKALKTSGFFTDILSADPDSNTIKHQIKIDLIRSKHNDSNNAIIIGDSDADIKCGKELGIQTIGVLSGMTNLHQMQSINPDIILPDLSFYK
jgi:phosphoglycolate phosphatase-like HAD superfamily hydrolase